MARQTLRASRTRSNSLMALSAASTLAAAAIGLAQSAQVIRMEDDGTGAVPQIIHFSMPDFAELRQPEYTPRDLPTFTDKLVLSEAQSKVVENLINEYIEAFKGLAVAHLPQTGGPMRVRLGPDGAGGEGVEGDGEGEAVFMALGDALPPLDELMAEDPELDEDMEGQMPRKMAVGVEVRMGDEAGAEGGDGGGGAAVAQQSGDASVSFSFQGADGEEIPEEVRKKLEEAAQKMAEKLKAQMEEQAAAGGDPHAAMPMMDGAMSVEQMQQRQEEMAAKVEEFRKEREALGRTFVTDVQSNLIPDQIDRWPALERTLLRQKSLPKGRLPGERIDLIKIVGAMELTEADRTKVASNLEAYEVSMDGALKRRDEFIATANSDVDKAMQANDPDKALAVIDRATDLRMAVRAVNQQFAQALAGMLPSEAAAALNARVLKASYPMIYRTTRGQKTFDVAGTLDGLSDSTKASLTELRVAYEQELADVNTQIRQTVDKYEPLEPRTAIERSKRVMSGESPEDVFGAEDQDPIREAYDKRRALDDRYCKLVADMLTPEQVALLPKAPSKQAMQPIIITRPVEAQ